MAKRKRDSGVIRVLMKTLNRLRKHLEKSGAEIMLFASQAIEEKLDREESKSTNP